MTHNLDTRGRPTRIDRCATNPPAARACNHRWRCGATHVAAAQRRGDLRAAAYWHAPALSAQDGFAAR
jgi:hypothetical protein